MSTHSIDAPAGFSKEIVYDRETRDYALYLNGELVGFARTYHESEVTLDTLVYEQMSRHPLQADENHICGDCGAALSDLGQCEGCREHAEPGRADVNWNSEPLTLPQAVALAVGEPEPQPQGPEEQTNWGGWRAPLWIGG